MKTHVLLICTIAINTVVSAHPVSPESSATESYAQALKAVVNDWGMVDYQGLKRDPQALNAYLEYLATLPESTVDQWPETDQIAFWINAYNGLTLKTIIDHYPIKSSFFRSLSYPKNSIRQISGVWKRLKFTVTNRPMTLDHIATKILRTQFNEPRIHMAMVRATMGCPPLRNEPYLGATLSDQLNDQTAIFLNSRDKFKIDRRENIVYLSPVLKWCGKDFEETYAPAENMGKLNKTLSAVFNCITPHVDGLFRPYLYRGEFTIKYLKYDWSLNEQ